VSLTLSAWNADPAARPLPLAYPAAPEALAALVAGDLAADGWATADDGEGWLRDGTPADAAWLVVKVQGLLAAALADLGPSPETICLQAEARCLRTIRSAPTAALAARYADYVARLRAEIDTHRRLGDPLASARFALLCAADDLTDPVLASGLVHALRPLL
jgi:hypothetical protein